MCGVKKIKKVYRYFLHALSDLINFDAYRKYNLTKKKADGRMVLGYFYIGNLILDRV